MSFSKYWREKGQFCRILMDEYMYILSIKNMVFGSGFGPFSLPGGREGGWGGEGGGAGVLARAGMRVPGGLSLAPRTLCVCVSLCVLSVRVCWTLCLSSLVLY
jgi:hypothetical protein